MSEILDFLGPFGGVFVRIGDSLINQVLAGIFGDGNSVRSTTVIIYNHSVVPIFKISDHFDSGGFSPETSANIILPKTASGYRVESHGIGTGVTGARIQWGLSPPPLDAGYVLCITTSNPFIGDNTQSVEVGGQFTATLTGSIGNHNTVEVDFWNRPF